MNDHQRALMDKAHRALDAARHSISRDDAETALNRAYYAAFYAAQAALLGEGRVPKTHTGVLRQIQARFVQPGRLSADMAQRFRFAFEARQQADYDAFATFDTRAAADMLSDVTQFVEAIDSLLRNPA